MEKLAYGLSLLMVVYLAFLYLTAKTVLRDAAFKNPFSDFIRKRKKET